MTEKINPERTHSLTLTMDVSNLYCRNIAADSLMLFSTQYKTSCLSAVSSHCLAALPAKM